MTLEVTAFRPSITEQPFYESGDSNDAGPPRLIGKKTLLDVQAEDDDTEVMMTEDNIVLMTVSHTRQVQASWYSFRNAQPGRGSSTGAEITILTF